GHEISLRLERLVVGVARDAVRTLVEGPDLAHLPDRPLSRYHGAWNEGVGTSAHVAGAADRRVGGGGAAERKREGRGARAGLIVIRSRVQPVVSVGYLNRRGDRQILARGGAVVRASGAAVTHVGDRCGVLGVRP